MEKTKKEVIRRVIGITILLISLPNLAMGAWTFIMVSVLGWTSDGSSLPLWMEVRTRLTSALYFLSTMALSFAAIQIIRNKLKALTYVALLCGMVSAIYLYSSWISCEFRGYRYRNSTNTRE